MSHQIFLIALHPDSQNDDAVRDELAETLHHVGGFVLMAAGASVLIAAFDEQWLPLFNRHAAVETCGALQLDPNGAAADKLRHLFAVNVAAQLGGRARPSTEAVAQRSRYRPLVWHRPAPHQPQGASGITISTQTNARNQP
jgi:hypothetical protein